jgi:hypothetical protein
MCPFRCDIDKYLRPERAKEIADALYAGAPFPCHQTTEPDEDEDGAGERLDTLRSAECAGALVTMEKEGFYGQHVRMAVGLGMYDPSTLKMDAPVYDSLGAWVASFYDIPTVVVPGPNGTTEVLEYEHCGVVGGDCEDPPGFMGSGGVMHSTEEPTCHPIDDCCSYCGNTMCTACRSTETSDLGDPVCVFCVEDEDEEETD